MRVKIEDKYPQNVIFENVRCLADEHQISIEQSCEMYFKTLFKC